MLNMAILFSNSSPKTPKSGIFGRNLRIGIYAPNFVIKKGSDFKYDNSFLQNPV